MAAIACVCTQDLLETALPGIDARRAEHWLRERSFVERLSGAHRFSTTCCVARLVPAPSCARPHRTGRVSFGARIADHVHGRASTDGLQVITDTLPRLDGR